jgi:peptidoglycan hydrolase-like protein with peptidoglycan-binding domain
VGFVEAARAVVCAVALAAVCAGGTQSADGSRLHGEGPPVDDWQAAPRLEERHTPPSDLVGLWQGILWADGYLPRTSVTCSYDATTVAATRVWQSNHRLSADGIVGPATYGAASRRLAVVPPWTVYHGDRFDLPLRRNGDGVYEVWDVGRFRELRLDAVTLAQCRR